MKEIKYTLEEGAHAPKYMTKGSVGMDIRAFKILTSYKGESEISKYKLEKMQKNFEERGGINLRPFERILFGTGIRVELPEGTELQVRNRSGMALKKGLLVANSPGTIDHDYRGEIGVILYNSTPHLVEIKKNDRIAQIVFNDVEIALMTEVSEEDFNADTERRERGFGSTKLE